jgi:hypothetical protein
MADKLFPKEIHQKLSELSVLTLNMRKSSLEIAETINYEFVHPIIITLKIGDGIIALLRVKLLLMLLLSGLKIRVMSRKFPKRLVVKVKSESNIGVWFWLILIIIINATWISMDLWLRAHKDEYLTTEFREGLQNPLWGPFIMGLVAFTIVAFLWHMLTTK